MDFVQLAVRTKQSNQQHKSTQMSATIMMPSTFDQAIRGMCSEAVNQAVTALAAKHGFDAEEAMRDVGLGEIKLVRKRGPSPKKETEKSVKKRKVKASGEPKAKRAKTGYLMFQDFVRAETRAELSENLAEDEKLKPQEVVKTIAAKWRTCGAEKQAFWNVQAAAAKRANNPEAGGLKGPRPSPVEVGHVTEDDAVLVPSDVDMTDDE